MNLKNMEKLKSLKRNTKAASQSLTPSPSPLRQAQGKPERGVLNATIFMISSILFLSLSVIVNAQVLPLDSILNTIEKNNSELKVYDAKANAYDTYATGAKALDAPQVGAGFFMTPYNTQMWNADPSMYSRGMGSFMLSAQQMFMSPQKLNASEKYMKSMSGVENEMKNATRNQLFSMAKMNYYEWILLKRKLHILKESEEVLNYLIKSTELRYTYGMDKLNAYYKAKGMLGDIQNVMVMTEQEINEQRVSLNGLMNRNKNMLFDVDTSMTFKNYETTLIDSSAIVDARSDFKVLKQNENVLRSKQTYEQTKSLPNFGIKYDHMLAFGTQPQLFSLMAMVSIPIAPWSSKMYKSTVAGLNYEIEALQAQQQGFVNNVSGTLENLKIKIKSKKLQIEISDKTIIPAMRRNYETALLAYEQNTEQLFMVLDAWQNLKLTELSQIDQLIELTTLQVQYENQLEIK